MTVEELRGKIDFIESMDYNSLTIDEIRSKLEPIVGLIAFGGLLYDSTLTFYRSVKLPHKPAQYSQLIYPPKEIVTSYQRVNMPGCPVFYCANSKHTSIFEGRYQPGDLIAISEWEVKKDQNLLATNVGFTTNLKKMDIKNNIPNWHHELRGVNMSDEEKYKNYLILDFLSEIFCKNFDSDNSKYKLSIAISNILGFNTESETEFVKIGEHKITGETPMEAILYPSILRNGFTENLAIRRSSFHKKLNFICVNYVRVINVNADDYEIEELDFSCDIDVDEKIVWKGRRGEFTLTEGMTANVTRVGMNKYTIESKDGRKLYRS